MKKYTQSQLLIFFLLLLATLFVASPPLMASPTPNLSEHQQEITQYIQDIRDLQDQIFSLLEMVSTAPIENIGNLNAEIHLIYSNLETVEQKLLDYVKDIPKLSPQRRDVLLSLIALNSVENSLYQLIQFIKEPNSVERTLLLEDFYFLRTSAANTLYKLESIISRE